jgi:uncharacterized protein (TIGR00304 family)
MADSAFLYVLGFVLVFVGVMILIAAVVLVSVFRGKNGKVKAAGVIVVGPVPIVFGSDKKSVKTLLWLSVVFTALLIAAMFAYYFLLR